MRIAIFQHTLNPTVIGWVRGLEERGHSVLNVIAYDTEPIGGWPDDLDVVILPNTSGRTNRLMRRVRPSVRKASYAFASTRSVSALLREERIEVALVKLYSLRNVIVLLMALRRRVRRVAWAEGTAPLAAKWRFLRTIGVVPRRWFVTNDARAGGVATPLDPPIGSVEVITYAPDAPPVRPAAMLGPGASSATVSVTAADGPIRMLVVSAFWDVDSKRPGWVLEAAHRAGILDGSVTFSFVGAGKEDADVFRRLQARIAELDASAVVETRLNVPFVAMSEVYAAHDVLVLPSLKEQFGMVVPEAMGHGLAVVASDAIGALGIIAPEVTGLIFPVDDLDALAGSLQRLAEDPGLARRMGRAGREFIEAHASSTVTADAILRLIGGGRR